MTKISIVVYPLVVVVRMVRRWNFLAWNMATLLSRRARLRPCGKEFFSKQKFTESCREPRDLPCSFFWGKLTWTIFYILHAAGPIRHMFVMGWAGKLTSDMQWAPWLRSEATRSWKEVRACGIIQKDSGRRKTCWNEEMGRALVIDFCYSCLKPVPLRERRWGKKKQLAAWTDTREPKHLWMPWIRTILLFVHDLTIIAAFIMLFLTDTESRILYWMDSPDDCKFVLAVWINTKQMSQPNR